MKMMFRDAILLTNEYLSRSSHLDHTAKKLSQSSRCFARGILITIYELFGLSEYINHTAELNSDSTRAQTRKFSANINFSGSY